MRDLIFVDTESTGLADDPDAQLIELTWATLDSEPKTLWFGVETVPEFIDDLIGFTKRGIAGRKSPWLDILEFLEASDGHAMVAANPSHDKHFLEKEGLWYFHYRMLDIESYAYAKLDSFDEVPSMNDIYAAMTELGASITKPDHTSRNDVLAMRDIYKYLESM